MNLFYINKTGNIRYVCQHVCVVWRSFIIVHMQCTQPEMLINAKKHFIFVFSVHLIKRTKRRGRYTTEEEAMKGKLKGNCISKITQVDLRKDLTDQQAQQNYHNQVDFYYI